MISFRHIEWAADIRLHFGSSFFLQQELTSTEGQRSIERAMSQIVASLEACGRYLETMKTFPSFMQAKESQLSSLTCQFGRHSWSLSEGSEALELLQRQAIWNETERSSLALAIQNGLSARAAATSRQTMQDYTNVILYLPKSIWEQLMNADLTFQAKANLLGVFATTLGMRTPSEATSQMMTALLLACPGGRELELKCSLSPVQLHELFLLVKKELRSSVAAAGTSDALPHVEKLPTNPAQMDTRWLQRALGAEPVGQCPLNLSQVAARAVTIPMRNTNRQLHDVTKGKGRQQMQKLRSLASSSPALLTLLPGLQDVDEGELEIPGFRWCARHGKTQQVEHPTLALEAPPQHSAPPALPMPLTSPETPGMSGSSAPAVTPPEATSVGAVSAAALLEEQWKEAKEVEKMEAKEQQEPAEEESVPVKTTKKEAKKPTPKAKKESKPQKSTKVTKGNEKSTGKKSQVAKTKVTRSRADQLKADFELRRAGGIPLKLLRAHQGGCGRCRNRPWCTRSCWALKGFDF